MGPTVKLSMVTNAVRRLNSLPDNQNMSTKTVTPVKSKIDPDTDQDNVILDPREQRVMAGSLDNLPPLHSKLVRIFTSSTFTDTQVERNSLMEHVYPRLKEFCRKKHGLEFQVVDMRWGVTDEALDDHMTVDVCLNEIKNCQKVSVGPNFMLLLGMKYGYRPLPRQVPVDEFDQLKDIIAEHKGNLNLLNMWYMQDSNAQPPVYVLLPISTHLMYFNKKHTRTLFERDQTSWWTTMGRLQKLLRDAASELYHRGGLTPHQYHNYFMSVTEREVASGILHADEPSKHCLVYVREILDIDEAPNEQKRNFIDVSFNTINEEPQILLHNLREKLEQMKPEQLPESNCREYNLNWHGNKGIDPDANEVHEAYLEEFSEHFETHMMRLIDESMASQMNRKRSGSTAAIYNEALQHLHACVNHCSAFQGQEDILCKVSDYVKGSSDTPLIIHGKSGCGKTSIMAKAYSQVMDNVDDESPAVAVIRFLGTSPASSLIISLLRNISEQIAINYGCQSENETPTELSLLIQHFNKMLSLATEDRPLILFLDSVDQLSTAYEARLLQWVPTHLPPNVKLVLSTLPLCEQDNILQTMQDRIPSPVNYIEVNKLGGQISKNILEAWLKQAGRCVTNEQQKEIDRVLEMCSLPLFLRLVFDQICRWRSFEIELAGVSELSDNIHDSINTLFERLEISYGKVFVSTAFSYLTVSRDGLSETELEDILSLDDELLNSVYQYHRPPVRRIPPLLWTRLRSEIPNYLTEREADGVNVINWYHRQFFEVASERYLFNLNIQLRFHSQLADYFLGVWSNKPKPFRYTEDQRKMFFLKDSEMDSAADRLVPEQPLAFVDNGNMVSYNRRKLSQLPYHLINAQRIDDLEKHVLLDFNWLHAKLSAMPLQSVLCDFIDALAVRFDPEIKIILDSLRLAGSSLTRRPNMLGTQIVGRLIPYYQTHKKIRTIIEKCDTDGISKNALVPANHCLHTPGGPLQYSLVGHSGAPFGIAVTSDKRYLVSVSRMCIIWDIEIGDVWRNIETPIRGIMQGLSLSNDDKYAVCYTNPDNQIVIISIQTGEFIICSNPFQATDKLRGMCCNDAEILVWTSDKWRVLNMQGMVIGHADGLQNSEFTILDMIMTAKANEPIIKLQRSHQGSDTTSCILRDTSTNAEDFKFSGSIALTIGRNAIFSCSPQLTTSHGNKNKLSKYASARSITVVTHYILQDQRWHRYQVLGETPYTVYSLTLSKDEVWLVASVEAGFILWKIKQNHGHLDRLDFSLPEGKKNYPGSRHLCVFSRNNEYMMAGSRKTLFVYDMKHRIFLKEITAHFDRMLDMLTVNTSKVNIAITSSSDKTLRIWNFDNIGKAVPVTDQHDKEIESVDVSRDGKSAVCVLRDAIGLWDITSGTLDKTLIPTDRDAASQARLSIISPTCQMNKMTCAAATNNGRFVIGADTQKLIFWEAETGDVLHMHYFMSEDDEQPFKHTTQLIITEDDKMLLGILKTKPNRLNPTEPMKGLCVGIKIPTWEVVFEEEFKTKTDCRSILTNNGLYLVVPIHSQKSARTRLGIWHVNTGTYLYDVDIDKLNASQMVNMVQMKSVASQVNVVDPEKASIVEINRKQWKKNSSGPYIRSFAGWNGQCTSNGKLGIRRSSDRMSLQIFNLHNGETVRILFSGQHPGDTEGETFLTNNDQHVIYHQSHRCIIKILRMESQDDLNNVREVAMCEPEARVCNLMNTSDGTELVIGLSDGRILVYVIADPELKPNIVKLQKRRERLLSPNNSATPLLAKARWTGAMNVARLAATANVITKSKSKICVIQ